MDNTILDETNPNYPDPADERKKGRKVQKNLKFIQRFFQVYELRRGHIYYRLTKFALLISITLLTVVFSINADVVKQYENYDWYRPWSLLKFVKSQLAIDTIPTISSLGIKEVNIPPKDYRFIFIVDRTTSTKLNPELSKYANAIKNSIFTEASNSGFSLTQLNTLTLQEILNLRMILSFYQQLEEHDENYKIEVGVAFYDGIKMGKNIVDQFSFARDFKKPIGENDPDPRDPSSYLEFEHQGLTKANFYKKVVYAFLEAKKNATEKIIDRTDFKTIFDEIDRRYFDEEYGKTIITLFSDFHHDIRDDKNRLPPVHFDQVEMAVKALATNNEIYQMNLISVPRINSTDEIIKETKQLIKIIKSRFNEAYYYQVNAPLLVNEKDINNRICEIIAPTIKEDSAIIFYYPYVDNKLGTSKEAKACLKFSNDNDISPSSCLLSLHSKEIFDNNHNLKLTYKFDSGNLEVADLNSYVHEEIRNGECIDASFYNSTFVQQYGDLSIDVFPFNSQYKKKFTISFREKLSKLNAIILGTATIASFVAFILYIFLMIGDWAVYYCRIKNSNPWIISFFSLFFSVFIYFIARVIAKSMWDNYMGTIETWYFKPITWLILASIISFFLYSIFINSAIQHRNYYSATSGLDKEFGELSSKLSSLDGKVSGLQNDYQKDGLGSLSRKLQDFINRNKS